ncbi:MAG: hypothetical protein MUC38_13710 [Cyclobacteriaceae bacterium]|jgi:hypothetical protein|nr:hypothetical protein [Cyclobacteriaceae bacterium]
MIKLNSEKLVGLKGGVDCSTIGGATVGLVVGFAALGVATGGLGFAVAAGLSGYFGTTGLLLCGMGAFK